MFELGHEYRLDPTNRLFRIGRETALRRLIAAYPRITIQKAEVALLTACGLSNKEIGTALGIQEATVKVHLKHLLRRLKLRGRSQLTVFILTGERPESVRALLKPSADMTPAERGETLELHMASA